MSQQEKTTTKEAVQRGKKSFNFKQIIDNDSAMAGEIRGIICIVLSLSLQITADPGIAFSRFRLCARFRPKPKNTEIIIYRRSHILQNPHKNSSDICIFMECVYVWGVDARSAAPSSSSSSHLFEIKIKTERLLLHRRRTNMARTLISLCPKHRSEIEIRTTSPANEESMFLKRDTRHVMRITCLLSSHANFISLSKRLHFNQFICFHQSSRQQMP